MTKLMGMKGIFYELYEDYLVVILLHPALHPLRGISK